ncbi:MAG: N-acetyltransferase [Spirochaetia bacterium]
MIRKVPCKTRKTEYTFSVEKLEGMFTVPSVLPEFKPMSTELSLRDGSKRTILIRSIREEEVDPLAAYVKQYTEVEYDFYDIVGARVFAELLAIKRNRMKDQYFFIGLDDGVPIGIANGRLRDKEINISLHTMAFKRQVNAGAILFYSKCWYAFEVCGAHEFWATFESYNGWVLAGLNMGLPTYPWPQVQHELGGAKVYVLYRDYWDLSIRDEYPEQVARAKLMPDAPADLIKRNETLRIPDNIET